MKSSNLVIIFICSVVLFSCGVPQAEYDTALKENERLKRELEDCQHGAEKLIAEIERAYSLKEYLVAKEKIKLLSEKHPESPKNKEFKALLIEIKKEEQAERKRKEEEEKERIRLENLNNTGIWTIRYYVDDFGEPTNNGYISNTLLISGTFSNTATQDSRLNVRFLISNPTNISIKLFEYAGNNPVKAYSYESYKVLLQDKDGERFQLIAKNYSSDRLTFDKNHSRIVHNTLMKGGKIKFVIVERDTPTTEYKFTIENADWYNNAYTKLKEL